MSYSVRTYWGKINDWSGHHEAESPEEALAIARREVSLKSGVSEEFLNQNAQFDVAAWPRGLYFGKD